MIGVQTSRIDGNDSIYFIISRILQENGRYANFSKNEMQERIYHAIMTPGKTPHMITINCVCLMHLSLIVKEKYNGEDHWGFFRVLGQAVFLFINS
jgi:hypothetical protein